MQSLINKKFSLSELLLNALFDLSPKRTLKLSLRLVSFLSKKKIRPEDRVYYNLGFNMTIEVEGRHLNGCIWGEGPVLILVHGWMSCSASWKAYISYFVQNGYQVRTIDAPGHGLNTYQHFDIAFYFKAIDHLIKETSNLYAIIGHSIGATAAFFGTLQNRHISIRKLVLISPYSSLHQLSNEMANFLQLNENFVEVFDEHVYSVLGRRLEELEITKHVSLLGSVEIDIIHADNDPVISQQESINITNVSPDNVALHKVEGTGHAKSHPKVMEQVFNRLPRMPKHNWFPITTINILLYLFYNLV